MPLYNPPSTNIGSSLGSIQLSSNTNVTNTTADILTLTISTTGSSSKVSITAPTRYSATLAGLTTILLAVDGVTQDTATISITLSGNGATTLTTEIILAAGSHTIKIRGSVTLGTLTFQTGGTAIYSQLVG